MPREYVEKRDGSYYLPESRVSLESIVRLFADGASPEAIVDDFPSLSLEQVYGAITFYLANRTVVDNSLRESDRLWTAAREEQPPVQSELRERLERARRDFSSRKP